MNRNGSPCSWFLTKMGLRLSTTVILGIVVALRRDFFVYPLGNALSYGFVVLVWLLLFWFAVKLPPRDDACDRHYQFRGKTVGHRGCRVARIPENSIEAFQHARRQGADGIEFDIQITKDRHIVVFHDLKVERVLKGTGFISDKTLNELRAIPFIENEKEHVPTLEEALKLAKSEHMKALIEVKSLFLSSDILRQLCEIPKKCHMEDNVVFMSFNPLALWQIRFHYPTAQTCLLFHTIHDVFSDAIRSDKFTHLIYEGLKPLISRFDPLYRFFCCHFLSSFLQVSLIGPHATLVSANFVTSFERKHIGVYSWVVNSRTQKRWFQKLGVCVGTDYVFTSGYTFTK